MRISKRLQDFFHHEASGGILLAAMAAVALILANSPINPFYQAILNTPVVLAVGGFEIAKPLLLWVNDGLMAIFFLLVGLEIKRELLQGHLSSRDQVILPAIAAIAGIAVPAFIYVAFNFGDPIAIKGWAVPSATDIAFALGVFSLFGTRLPITLKLFLLAVAIFDDIGAIIIIALFYSQDLSAVSLGIAAAGLAGLLTLNRMKVAVLAPYIIIGIIVWTAVLKSGVHATLAGFLIAWFIPLNVSNQHGQKMLPAMEHGLHPWVAFFILPVFAFFNAGVSFIGASLDDLVNPITVGIALGLFVGKQVGILGFCWVAVKLKIAKLPTDANWTQLYGVSLLCGIGFTMSLFIGTLAFEGHDPSYLASVKIGVVFGSLLSGIVGAFIIARSSPALENRQPALAVP